MQFQRYFPLIIVFTRKEHEDKLAKYKISFDPPKEIEEKAEIKEEKGEENADNEIKFYDEGKEPTIEIVKGEE